MSVGELLKGVVRPAYRLGRNVLCRYQLMGLASRPQRRIVVGASGISEPGWIGTEMGVLNLLEPRTWEQYMALDSLDAILAEHVWEHLTREEGMLAAQMCYRYLRPGGYLRVAVPDGLFPSAAYIESVRPGGTGPGACDHRILYTYRALASVFGAVGFSVDLLEYFDEHGIFHFREWSPGDGKIWRSSRFDPRNAGEQLEYTSIILDARK